MMKFVALILIVIMTFNAQASERVVLEAGEKAPFQGLLVDAELFQYIQERIDKIDAAESALVKQNDMLIEVQKQKIVLEFERDKAIANGEKKDTAIVIIMMIAAALVAGK